MNSRESTAKADIWATSRVNTLLSLGTHWVPVREITIQVTKICRIWAGSSILVSESEKKRSLEPLFGKWIGPQHSITCSTLWLNMLLITGPYHQLLCIQLPHWQPPCRHRAAWESGPTEPEIIWKYTGLNFLLKIDEKSTGKPTSCLTS